mmetsp:Transcript_29806/g.65173  ORF Transcript_29806/g.65173 Transcript_29806/m.65173 type:complete len:310 (+) Transcript_29806:901-1830(+)
MTAYAKERRKARCPPNLDPESRRVEFSPRTSTCSAAGVFLVEGRPKLREEEEDMLMGGGDGAGAASVAVVAAAVVSASLLVGRSASASWHKSSKLASRSSMEAKTSITPNRGSERDESIDCARYSHVTDAFSLPLRKYVFTDRFFTAHEVPYHVSTAALMTARRRALSECASIESSLGWQLFSFSEMEVTKESSSPTLSDASASVRRYGITSSLECLAMLSLKLAVICLALRCTRACLTDSRLESSCKREKTAAFMCVNVPRKSSAFRMSATFRSSWLCESTRERTVSTSSLCASFKWYTPSSSARSSG